MKISNSKKQLAQIIHENGGWCDGAQFYVSTCNGIVVGSKSKPRYTSKYGWVANGGFFEDRIKLRSYLKNWHQTILSRDEYFHLYPAPDADGWIEWNGGECPVGEDDRIDVKFSDGDTLFDVDNNWDWSGNVDMCNIIAYHLHKPEPEIQSEIMEIAQVGDINVVESKPTIEQLAADYRNRKDYAERKQEEADAAKAGAEAKLAELVAAGEALGLVLSIAGVGPELVINDWRDLQVGDVVWYGGDDELSSGEYHVMGIESTDYVGYRTVLVNGDNGGHWIDIREGWCFIRRP